MENQTMPYKMANNTPPHLDNGITKKKPRFTWKSLIWIEI